MTKKYEDYTREQLLEEIKKLKRQKKFGLVWEEKTEEVVEQCKTNFPVLHEISERAISGNDSPTHLIIEGDNYHSLSVLNVTHKGKIDVIYIDPPYNTGNKDFKYNDSFVDKEDSFRHSKWISFMNKRLKLAKELLSEKGVIFISIDDNEQANLKLLCDTIFGENKFVNNITVKSSETSGVKMNHTEKKLPKIKEYILVYSKTGTSQFNSLKISKTDDIEKFSKYSKYYSKIIENPEDAPENWNILSIQEYQKKYNLSLTTNEEVIQFKLDNAERVIYRTNNKSFNKLQIDKPIAKIISSTGLEYIWWEGKQMLFLSDYIEESLCDLWTDISTINLNKEMAGLPSFENGQKPLELLKRVIKLSDIYKSVTILDFFAGSGTTGHAVLELNKEDGGNRQFILCTNNENNICEEVTYPRIKTVITGQRPDGTKYADRIPANIRYFKTDFVEKSEDTDENRIRLTNRCYELLQIKESCYDKQNSKVENLKIWRNEGKLLAVIFDRYDNTDDKKYISEIVGFAHNSDEVVVYRFSIDGNLDMDISALPNARLEEIPEEILKTFNQIFKTKKKRK